ncbi:MAG: antitoxin VapB family protein [Euryarchaeota archaeon]|nr:antitoxin VapB family protein [Euryarchaeota archaeon]
MATKTINLTTDAYKRLASLKRGSESFSDVVNRLTGKYALLDLIGIFDDRTADELRKAKKDFDRRLRKDMDRIARRMS